MNQCKVYSISELPAYSVKKSMNLQFLNTDLSEFIEQLDNDDDAIDEAVAPSFEPESIKKSNERNTLVGNLGEEIAKAYLCNKYPRSIYPKVERIATEKSNKGYDIIAKDVLCFEVKTSLAKNFEFEITINELRTANEKRQNYHLFYIMIDTDKKTAIGFIFNNPIENFGIDFDKLTCQVSIFEPTRFHGKLQEHIYLAEKVELTQFLAKVLDKKSEYAEKLFTKANEKLEIVQTVRLNSKTGE